MVQAVSTPGELAVRYLQAWNESDPQRRRALVAEVFSDNASYVDPLAEVAGHEGLCALIGGMQAKFAGARFSLKGTPEGHHDRVRFSWALAVDGKKLAEGTDVALLAPDGRLEAVTGFLDYVDPGLA
jgi:hypothetical protein